MSFGILSIISGLFITFIGLINFILIGILNKLEKTAGK